jgi:hypothetical protein
MNAKGPLSAGFIPSRVLAKTVAIADQRTIVVAHRGASGHLPQHPLAAKALARGMGADFIEQDVVLTKDNQPIALPEVLKCPFGIVLGSRARACRPGESCYLT